MSVKQILSENQNKNIEEILEKINNLSVIELSALSEAFKDQHNITAMSVASSSTGASSETKDSSKDEKKEFDVVLKSVDPKKKILAIKEVRAITGLGLKESKALIEGEGSIIKSGISKDESNSIKEKLQNAGCAIELK